MTYKYNKKERSISFDNTTLSIGDTFTDMIIIIYTGTYESTHQIVNITPKQVHHKSTDFDGIFKDETEDFIKHYKNPIKLNLAPFGS
jgi:hypothetical protein